MGALRFKSSESPQGGGEGGGLPVRGAILTVIDPKRPNPRGRHKSRQRTKLPKQRGPWVLQGPVDATATALSNDGHRKQGQFEGGSLKDLLHAQETLPGRETQRNGLPAQLVVLV